MALRLYTDEDVHGDLASALRSLGHDADSCAELGALRLTDPRQLAQAVDLGRAIITSNRLDFRMLHETLIIWHERWHVATPLRHHGILIVPHISLTDLITIVDEFANAHTAVDNRLFLWAEQRGWHEPLTAEDSR